ncbi:MAG: LysR family transcriptional regulator [Proteobacteria bacterium]|nr:LysR family transcriptional regulator [Pseudomonadota bacterium]
MELNQLQQIVVVADETALCRAAKKLHISQSALTRSIQRLEDELGTQLFDRTHNSIKLNEAGKIVVRHARLMLKEADALMANLDALNKHLQTLHIVTCSPAPLWKLSFELSKEFPGIRITSDMPNESELVSQLLTEKASIAITRHEIHTDEIDSMPLMDEQTYMLVPISDPLSNKKAIHFSDLKGREICEYTHTGFWHQLLRENIEDAHYLDYDDIMVYFNAVITQKPLTFVSGAHNLNIDTDGCVRIPIADKEATAHCYIVWLKKNKPILATILNWITKISREW